MEFLEDHHLMLKVKSGEVEKLNLLYRRYSRRFFGFFYSLTGDGATAEDLVQNVFLRIIKYKHTYSEKGDFEVWAFQMARNVHRDHFRKNKRYQFHDEMEAYDEHLKEPANAETLIEKRDEMALLQKALSRLSLEKRELIELVKFQKVKYAKAAELLNISESAVKVRVHRILKELKETYVKLDG